jgi:hypothetical protein
MARRQVSIFINGKEVANEINTITREKNKLNSELRKMTLGTDEYQKKAAELRRVNRIFKEHNEYIRGVDNAWQKLAKSGITKIAGLAAGAFAADVIIDYAKQLFNLATEMELLERKAATVFGDTLPQVTQAAIENAAQMGLTAAQYVNAAASIGDLLIPMQFTRQEAAAMSTDLVDLSGALSEWTGGQIAAEDVTRILSKAVLGEREELKQLGISIMETDVTARLAEKGLKNLTGTMLQQAKATATLELITEKSVDAQTAFANNSDLSARKQAELSARLQDISAKLATTLIPVFEQLVDIAEDVVGFLDGLADALVALNDPAAAAVKSFDDQTGSVKNLERELTPLLERYEVLSAKTNLTAEEQDELKKVIQQIGEVTPVAITKIDEYGNALSVNADKSREFMEAEKARLEFMNKDAIQALEDQIEGLEARREAFTKIVETGRGGLANIEYDPTTLNALRKDVAEATKDIEGARAQLARLTGADLNQPDAPATTGDGLSPTAEERAAQQEAAEKLRKQREDQAKKALQDRKRQLEQLADALLKFEEDQSLSRLTADERELEQIRLKYQKQIEIALALEAQGVTQATESRIKLEKLRDEELLLLSLAQAQAKADAENKLQEELNDDRIAREQEFAARRAEAIREIQEVTRAVILSDQELAVIELEEYYQNLRDLATQFGLDTLDIDITYRREQERLRKEFLEKGIKDTMEAKRKEAQLLAEAFSGISSIIGSAIDTLGDKSKSGVALQKLLTLAQIGFNTAAGISAAVAAGAGLLFPANLGAIATGVGAVLSGVASAKAAFAEAPQFFGGGYTKVKGAQDGRTYNAKYIGQAPTMMLPNRPTLIDTSIGTVLGSERGSEYFVSNKDMKNPVVMNYVRAIDNITKYRQFAEGGATNPGAISSNQGMDTSQLIAATSTLTGAVMQLNEILSRPIYARIDDDTVIDIRDQLNKIVTASGGVA